MRRLACLSSLAPILALSWGSATAATRYYEIAGGAATAPQENACPAWVIESNQDDCSYNAANPTGAGTAQWIGPVFSAGYYAPGAGPAVFANPPVPAPVLAPSPIPGLGGTTGIPIARGFVSIDDKNTPLDGTDDTIAGTIEFGAFERNVGTGPATRTLEQFDRVIHRVGGTAGVGAATPNGAGGFDYIVGSSGGVAEFPTLIAGAADDFPSATASQSSPDAGDIAYWTAPGSRGIARLEGGTALRGLLTGATVWGYSCDAGGGAGSCLTNSSNWEADRYAAFRNVLLRLSTNAGGDITSAEAVLVNESSLSVNLGGGDTATGAAGNDSWRATTLAFTAAETTLPRAFDDRGILAIGLDLGLTVSVLANDVPGVAPATVSIVSPPSQGTATVLGNASIDYVPPASPVEGTVEIGYRITDANSQTADGLLEVILTDPIGCADDLRTTAQNEVSTVAVLDNDFGFDIPPVEVRITSAPSQGTAVVNPDRSITFTPPQDLGGFFSIGYELSDGYGDVANCAVGITVEANPVAVDDTQPVKIDTTTDIQVLANDIGVTDTPLTLAITQAPSSGSAVVVPPAVPSGTPIIRYTPAAGFVGTDSLRYQVTDNDGDVSNEATVAITVFGPPASNPPVCTNDVVNGERNAPTIVDVLANDTGLEVEPIALSVVQQPAGGNAAVTSGARTITFNPPADTGGAFTFRYRVSEAINPGVECSATVLVNDTPVAVDDQFVFQSGAPTALTVTNNDTGLTDGPLNIEIVQPPQHGTVEVLVSPASGFPFIGYTANAGYAGPDSLQYRILDCVSIDDVDADGFCSNTRDASNVATVSLTITSIPEAVDDGDPFPFPFRTTRDRPITIDVLANDLGLAQGPIRVEIALDGNGNPIVLNGTAVVNPDNTVTFTPSPGFVGRSPTPGEIFIENQSGAFQKGERVDVRDGSGNLVFFGFIFEALPDRLQIQDVGPTVGAVPPRGATLTGAVSGSTAIVGPDYRPPCQFGCSSPGGGAGFRYQIFDGDGIADETFGEDNDSEGLALIDVFPGAVTDTGGSSFDAGVLLLLTGAGLLRRRARSAQGRTRTGTTR